MCACVYVRIEPKHKDKQFRLASLRTGEEGLVETVSWIQVNNCFDAGLTWSHNSSCGYIVMLRH